MSGKLDLAEISAHQGWAEFLRSQNERKLSGMAKRSDGQDCVRRVPEAATELRS